MEALILSLLSDLFFLGCTASSWRLSVLDEISERGPSPPRR